MAKSDKVPYVEFSADYGIKIRQETTIDRSQIPALLGENWEANHPPEKS